MSGGAGDAIGVDDGRGSSSQHNRHRRMKTGVQHAIMAHGRHCKRRSSEDQHGAVLGAEPQADIETYAVAYGESEPRAAPGYSVAACQVKSSSGATRPRGDHPGPASCNFLPPSLRGLLRCEWGRP